MANRGSHPIARYRVAHNLTLEAFGALVGAQKGAVCKWEQGKGPSPASALAIETKTRGILTREILRPDLFGVVNHGAGR